MSSSRFTVALCLSVFLASCGNQKTANENLTSVPSDTLIESKVILEDANEGDAISPNRQNLISFYRTVDNPIKQKLTRIPAFAHVYELTNQYVKFQDSLEAERKLWGQPLTDPKDTLLVFKLKQRAYQAIMHYKMLAANGAILEKTLPGLLDLTRVTEAGDSSLELLPPPDPSTLLAAGDFFFLGGAPFISRIAPPDETTFFANESGEAETRFGLSLQDNAEYLITSVISTKDPRVQIDYGPPLHTYEMGEIEVFGIGSLIHKFEGRIPAFFITEEGLISSQLVSARLKLGEDYNCGSGNVYVEFACAGEVDEQKILAIYIPYGDAPTSSTFARLSDHVLTMDLNSDGVADFACVRDSYMGDTGYEIYEALWYANINGSWQIIDWAAIPECT